VPISQGFFDNVASPSSNSAIVNITSNQRKKKSDQAKDLKLPIIEGDYQQERKEHFTQVRS